MQLSSNLRLLLESKDFSYQTLKQLKEKYVFQKNLHIS